MFGRFAHYFRRGQSVNLLDDEPYEVSPADLSGFSADDIAQQDPKAQVLAALYRYLREVESHTRHRSLADVMREKGRWGALDAPLQLTLSAIDFNHGSVLDYSTENMLDYLTAWYVFKQCNPDDATFRKINIHQARRDAYDFLCKRYKHFGNQVPTFDPGVRRIRSPSLQRTLATISEFYYQELAAENSAWLRANRR